MDIFCEVRAQIAHRIAEAIQEWHQIKGTPPSAERAMALQRAKEAQRKAERELNTHVKQHGCKMHGGVGLHTHR
jgi:hypothetical protein